MAEQPRALSFGAVADLYDRARPGYPDPLFADIAALLPGPQVIEVGAGTGKATSSLLRHGLAVTCLEPDPAMAAILIEHYHVPVISSTFENWTPDTTYDGLTAAQSWHWTDPATCWDQAATALRPGGIIALFWNATEPDEDGIGDRINEVYAAAGITDRPLVRTNAPNPKCDEAIAAHPAFESLGARAYRWTLRYTADSLVDYLNSTSHHRLLTQAQRDTVAEGVRSILPDDGYALPYRADLHLGRRLG